MSIIGENIKSLMHQNRLSAKELAKAIKVPPSSLSTWLTTEQQPRGDVLVRLSKHFGVSVDYLLTGEHPETIAAREIIGEMERQFFSVSSGIYRVTIEKEVALPNTQKNKKDRAVT